MSSVRRKRVCLAHRSALVVLAWGIGIVVLLWMRMGSRRVVVAAVFGIRLLWPYVLESVEIAGWFAVALALPAYAFGGFCLLRYAAFAVFGL
jgi:hypothetical protein